MVRELAHASLALLIAAAAAALTALALPAVATAIDLVDSWTSPAP